MLIISIEANENGFHSLEEQAWRNEVWQEGYARVPEDLHEEAWACVGYCDLEIGKEKGQPVVTRIISKGPLPILDPTPDPTIDLSEIEAQISDIGAALDELLEALA